MSFKSIDHIFGEVSADWSPAHGSPLKPFLFHVLAGRNDENPLEITVTDFQSNTFQAIKSHIQIEDMRDSIGIGGSWSEFVDYIIESLKSEDVKLVMEGSSEAGGASHARLIAKKAKGMPRVSISLGKLVDGAAHKAMGNLSLELYSQYKMAHSSLVEVRKHSDRLTKIVADEREKNVTIQKQLDLLFYSKKHKSQNANVREDSDTSVMVIHESPDKQTFQSPNSKVTNRVVPAHRRSKVRGAILEDTENDSLN